MTRHPARRTSTVAKKRLGAQGRGGHRPVGAHHDDRDADEGPDPGRERRHADAVKKAFNVRLALARDRPRRRWSTWSTTACTRPATYWVVKGLTGFQGNEAFDKTIGYDLDSREEGAGRRRLPRRRRASRRFKIIYRDNAAAAERGRLPREGMEGHSGINDRTGVRRQQDALGDVQCRRLPALPWRLAARLPGHREPARRPVQHGRRQQQVQLLQTRTSTRRSRPPARATSDAARIKAYQDVETAIVDEPLRRHPDLPGRAAVHG